MLATPSPHSTSPDAEMPQTEANITSLQDPQTSCCDTTMDMGVPSCSFYGSSSNSGDEGECGITCTRTTLPDQQPETMMHHCDNDDGDSTQLVVDMVDHHHPHHDQGTCQQQQQADANELTGTEATTTTRVRNEHEILPEDEVEGCDGGELADSTMLDVIGNRSQHSQQIEEIASSSDKCRSSGTTTTHNDGNRLRRTRRRRLHLIRHGQSETNVAGASIHVFDPVLTATGTEQAAVVGAQVRAALLCGRMDLNNSMQTPHIHQQQQHHSKNPPQFVVLTSPLFRALQTTQFAFCCANDDDNGVESVHPNRVVAMEDLREVVGQEKIAELRRPLRVLAPRFPSVDFSSVDHDMDPMAHLAVDIVKRAAGPGERRVALEERARRVWDRLRNPAHSSQWTDDRSCHPKKTNMKAQQDDDDMVMEVDEVEEEEDVVVVSHYHLLHFLCREISADAYRGEQEEAELLTTSSSVVSTTTTSTMADQIRRVDPMSTHENLKQQSTRATTMHELVSMLRSAVEQWPNGGLLTITYDLVEQEQAARTTLLGREVKQQQHQQHSSNIEGELVEELNTISTCSGRTRHSLLKLVDIEATFV